MSLHTCDCLSLTSPRMFKARLLEEPLNVEILRRSPEATGGLDSSLGWAVIPLGEVFSRPIINMTSGYRRTKDNIAEVKLNGKPMAQISYSLVLDDFGVFNSSPTVEVNKYEEVNSDGLKMVTENTANKSPTDIRQTSEYRTALELELWKAKEEERFKNALKHREQKMLMVFAQEWKRREEERESMCKKKMHEYQVLEDKLRSVLEDLMDRERQLNAKETNLSAVQLELERKIELRERDLMDGVQRKIREAEQTLGAEQQRNSQLNNEVYKIKVPVKDDSLYDNVSSWLPDVIIKILFWTKSADINKISTLVYLVLCPHYSDLPKEVP
ncbi:hypothetical protein ACTXT7_008809 [Hymenolepis weldensis]